MEIGGRRIHLYPPISTYIHLPPPISTYGATSDSICRSEIGARGVPHLAGSRIIDLHHRQVLDTTLRLVWAWHASTENLMPARHACSRSVLRDCDKIYYEIQNFHSNNINLTLECSLYCRNGIQIQVSCSVTPVPYANE